MTVEHLRHDTKKYGQLSGVLLGMLYINQRLPSVIDTKVNAEGMSEMVVNVDTREERAMYHAAYPVMGAFVTSNAWLFGMGPTDFQIHGGRGDDTSMAFVFGFGEVAQYSPIYVVFKVEWCNPEDFVIRNTPKARQPWNILLSWSDELLQNFKANQYYDPMVMSEVLHSLQQQFRIFNGYHNAGVGSDQTENDTHWFHCEHYARSEMLPPGTGYYRLTATIEVKEGAYDVAFHRKQYPTVGVGEEWGIDTTDRS